MGLPHMFLLFSFHFLANSFFLSFSVCSMRDVRNGGKIPDLSSFETMEEFIRYQQGEMEGGEEEEEEMKVCSCCFYFYSDIFQ